MFAKRGYEAASVEEIADKAKVSKPIVYEHFGGKEGLYAVVVDREMDYVVTRIAEAISGEKAPVDIGSTDNGPDTLKTKDQIIEYFRASIAFTHKAVGAITEKNMNDPVPFGRNGTKASAAAFIGLHSYDHYGQMVVYARMNGVIPGGGPPPAGKQKQK